MDAAFQKVLLFNFGTAVQVGEAITYYGTPFRSSQKIDQAKPPQFNSPAQNQPGSHDQGFIVPGAYHDPRPDVSAVSLYNNPVLSLIGTPVFSNFNLEYGGKELSHAINAVLFTVTQTTNILETMVQGRDGTVKEYISAGDWKINAKIVISAIDRSFPAILAQEIREMLAIKDAINIHSWFLNDVFNIYQVVVKERSFEQHQSRANMSFINIEFISDIPETLD